MLISKDGFNFLRHRNLHQCVIYAPSGRKMAKNWWSKGKEYATYCLSPKMSSTFQGLLTSTDALFMLLYKE